ncbi:ribosomal protein S5 domain 2-type protein [Ochromonadaceae sp. CCMP2298]|nr:ribosomal protein S5 domain 2-type protein [Ochromonadaceae sp. CCMP2298]
MTRKNKSDAKFQRLTCLSAPGKVLVAGGYLVLESPNLGLTISTSSRFYTSVRLQPSDGWRLQSGNHLIMKVHSPQFHSCYVYRYDMSTDKVTALGASNAFVEKCIALTMAFIKQYKKENGTDFCGHISEVGATHFMDITLRADNDFYSQIQELKRRKAPLLSLSLKDLPRFLPCPKDANGEVQIAKTGLGSSAALTTSLVASLLQWFDVTRIGLRPDSEDRRIVHNLAQLVHANAQGKIGSGFDVAAAVYGTQMYRRFSSGGFDACMAETVAPSLIYAAVMQEGAAASIPASASVNALTDQRMMEQGGSMPGWSQTIRPFSLPHGVGIVLGDVCGGSSSTSMARQVLKWKREKPQQAEKVWDTLAFANAEIFKIFEQLNLQYQRNPAVFDATLAWAAEAVADVWLDKKDNETIASLLNLRGQFQLTRQLLKQMGQNAGVHIEPPSQSLLADATIVLPGVLAAGVPGAGGEDALFAITLSPQARSRVENMWSEWGKSNSTAVCPLLLEAGAGLQSGVCALLGNNALL